MLPRKTILTVTQSIVSVTLTLLLAVNATSIEPTVNDLLNGVDDMMRGKSSRATVRMSVKTSRWERELVMQALSKGRDKTLVQIVEPAKEKGTATLKVGNNIWNYLPKVDRTIKVPGSMMSGSWMGSHFTNDDLVKDSRFADDYECGFTETPPDDVNYVIECVPHIDAAVVWGKVVVTIRGSNRLVERVEFFDERNELVRSMLHSEVVDIGDRLIPKRVRVVPADKSEEYTEVLYEQIEFDVDIPDGTFSLRTLRR